MGIYACEDKENMQAPSFKSQIQSPKETTGVCAVSWGFGLGILDLFFDELPVIGLF
jgi:hypothetical protein